jgi:nicotinamidase-related amidase
LKEKKMKLHLLVIDPQKDFCDPHGSLFVTGADQDMDRLALMVDRLSGKIDDIHVTMDSHRKIDISHPLWWKDSAGRAPNAFTVITVSDLETGRWTTRQPGAYSRSLRYLKALEAGKRYPHVIWPEHCLIGDEGHTVHTNLANAVHGWEHKRYAMADFITKGSNPWTEHFSAVQAEVPDPEDPSTQINSGLIATLEEADIILLAGEALSHCLANTGRDIVNNFSDPKYTKKLVLLTDASSNVPTFEQYGSQFVSDLTAKGMQTSTTVDFLR